MKRKLYKISCLILSALLPLLMVAELVGVQIQKNNFQKQLILNSPNLYKYQETIFITQNEFSNQTTGDEIELNGNRYDIISVSKEKEGYYLKVFNDTFEQKVDALLSQQSTDNNPSKNSSKKSIQSLNFFFESVIDFNTNQKDDKLLFVDYTLKCKTGFNSLPFLPPEFC